MTKPKITLRRPRQPRQSPSDEFVIRLNLGDCHSLSNVLASFDTDAKRIVLGRIELSILRDVGAKITKQWLKQVRRGLK